MRLNSNSEYLGWFERNGSTDTEITDAGKITTAAAGSSKILVVKVIKITKNGDSVTRTPSTTVIDTITLKTPAAA